MGAIMVQRPELIRVKASAGAGKTYQLALRYISLLKGLGEPSGSRLRSIVAITFTNKAAAEMKERILLFLKEIAFKTERGKELQELTGLSPQEAKGWVDTIVGNYSDFQVRTIDSLLYAMLKGLSFERGMDPEAEVRFDHDQVINQAFELLVSAPGGEHQGCINEALNTYLRIENSPGFYPERNLRRKAVELLQKVLGKITLEQKGIDGAEVEEARKAVEEGFKDLVSAIDPLKGQIKQNLLRPIYERDGSKKDLDVEKICDLKSKAILKEDKGLDAIFKKKALGSIAKEDMDTLDAARNRLRGSIDRYSELLPYWKAQGYIPLLRALSEQVERLCREERLVLGGEWTRVIGEEMERENTVPFIGSIFGCRFAHFLFDEFQDTSRDQWNAMLPILQEALAQGGSLLIVGDVKQAIYRWRGGDWCLFDEVVGHRSPLPTGGCIKEEVLQGNFRSHSELVGFFNWFCQQLADKDKVKTLLQEKILGDNAPPSVVEEAASSISQAFSDHKQEPKRDFSGPATIEFYLVDGNNQEETRQNLRPAFMERIKKEWEARKGIEDKTQVAVLVRSTDHARLVSGWLLQEGIPTVTDEALQLQVSQVVKGLVSLLRYLYDPKDKAARYGFLASGICNSVTEDKLASQGADWEKGVWRGELEGLRKGLGLLANRGSPYEAVQEAMELLKLDRRLKEDLAQHRPFVEQLLEVIHNFQAREGPSLGRFLSFWDEGGAQEQVGMPENIPAVRVLTIHKAKGLEFPVVFVPFTDWKLHHQGMVEVHEERLAVLGSYEALPPKLQELKARLLAQQAQELLNLFYVAITRAEEALYLFLTPRGHGVAEWVNELFKRKEMPCQVQSLS